MAAVDLSVTREDGKLLSQRIYLQLRQLKRAKKKLETGMELRREGDDDVHIERGHHNDITMESINDMNA